MPGHPYEEMGPPARIPARQIHRQRQKPLQNTKPPARIQKRPKETPYFAVFEPFQIIYCKSCKDLIPTSAIGIGIHLQSPCYGLPPGPKLDKAALQARALLPTTEDDRNMIRRRGELYTLAAGSDMILPEVPWLRPPVSGYFCLLCGQPRRNRTVLREHMRRVHDGENDMWGTTLVQSFRSAGADWLTFRVRRRG
ncbi:unnamed protein product [Clonostachys byssicola]|uniref:C2H2-type domain-containing protein n=1 Tax=Clonostachys byssicola TaxID=160290 RepID=A0A9N9U468_9HYPO|nr:unnamed protein product [Clonostachys byssicola]